MTPRRYDPELHRAIARLSSAQAGLFTAEQLAALDPVDWSKGLRRLMHDDVLAEIRPQVFRHLAVPGSDQVEARAAWLATRPASMSGERRNRTGGYGSPGFVIGGAAAARRWGIGYFALSDVIWEADPTDLGLASDPVRFETATLDDEDVVWDDDGYPYTSVERTIADGFFLEGDFEHAAAALEDAPWALHALVLARLRQLVEHHPLSSAPESSGTFESLVEAAGGYPLQPDRPYGFHRWRRYNPSRP